MVERTFIAIKPDGVQRGLMGEIISRFEAKVRAMIVLAALQSLLLVSRC